MRKNKVITRGKVEIEKDLKNGRGLDTFKILMKKLRRETGTLDTEMRSIIEQNS